MKQKITRNQKFIGTFIILVSLVIIVSVVFGNYNHYGYYYKCTEYEFKEVNGDMRLLLNQFQIYQFRTNPPKNMTLWLNEYTNLGTFTFTQHNITYKYELMQCTEWVEVKSLKVQYR